MTPAYAVPPTAHSVVVGHTFTSGLSQSGEKLCGSYPRSDTWSFIQTAPGAKAPGGWSDSTAAAPVVPNRPARAVPASRVNTARRRRLTERNATSVSRLLERTPTRPRVSTVTQNGATSPGGNTETVGLWQMAQDDGPPTDAGASARRRTGVR